MTPRTEESLAAPKLEIPDLSNGVSNEVPAPESGVTAPPWSELSISRRLLRPRTLISFGVAVAVVVIAFSRLHLDFGTVFDEMSRANPLDMVLAFVTYYASLAFRSWRWRYLLENADVVPKCGPERPSVPHIYSIFVLSWFVNCLVPAKLGDAYRGYLLKQRQKSSFAAALGTIVAERLIDLMSLAILLLVSGLLVFGEHIPAQASGWMELAIGLGIALFIGVLIAYRFRSHLRGIVPERIKHHYIRVEEGLLGSFRRIPIIAGLTLIIWSMEGLRLYFVTLSVSAHISIPAALFVALLASLLTVIPFTPAGLGFVEVGTVGVLALLGATHATGASVAFLDRLVAYWSVILVGAVLYPIMRLRWRKS